MSKYQYKAKEGTNKLVTGSVEAASEAEAINKIIRLGFTPISVETEKSLSEPATIDSVKIPLSDIAIFSRQLSALLDSGVNLLRALGTVKTQTENEKLAFLIDKIAASVKEGKSLSESMAKYPKAFSGVYVALVRAGEEGGMLSNILNQVTHILEREDDLRSNIIDALIYPFILIFFTFVSLFVLLTFVVPRFVQIFVDLGQELPLMTQALISVSGFLSRTWVLIVLLMAFFVFVIHGYYKTKEGRLYFDRLKLQLPILGRFINHVELSNFCNTLGSLLTNGVPIVQSLRSAQATLNNAALSESLDEINKQVTKGASFSTTLSNNAYFPGFIINLVSIGEETGALDKSLIRIAQVYDKEIEKNIKRIVTLIEPVIIVFLVVVILFIVLSMLLPIIQITAFI